MVSFCYSISVISKRKMTKDSVHSGFVSYTQGRYHWSLMAPSTFDIGSSFSILNSAFPTAMSIHWTLSRKLILPYLLSVTKRVSLSYPFFPCKREVKFLKLLYDRLVILKLTICTLITWILWKCRFWFTRFGVHSAFLTTLQEMPVLLACGPNFDDQDSVLGHPVETWCNLEQCHSINKEKEERQGKCSIRSWSFIIG